MTQCKHQLNGISTYRFNSEGTKLKCTECPSTVDIPKLSDGRDEANIKSTCTHSKLSAAQAKHTKYFNTSKKGACIICGQTKKEAEDLKMKLALQDSCAHSDGWKDKRCKICDILESDAKHEDVLKSIKEEARKNSDVFTRSNMVKTLSDNINKNGFSFDEGFSRDMLKSVFTVAGICNEDNPNNILLGVDQKSYKLGTIPKEFIDTLPKVSLVYGMVFMDAKYLTILITESILVMNKYCVDNGINTDQLAEILFEDEIINTKNTIISDMKSIDDLISDLLMRRLGLLDREDIEKIKGLTSSILQRNL